MENHLYNCLDSKIKKRPVGNLEDFLNYSRMIESYYIKRNYLKDTTKESYFNFLKSLLGQKNQIKKEVKNIDKSIPNDFNFNVALVFSYYKDCHKGLEVTNTALIDEVNERLEIYDDLELESFKDYESMVRIINNTNFKSDLDRYMLLSVIQIFTYNIDR